MQETFETKYINVVYFLIVSIKILEYF